jgi:hypothetical protein
MDPSPTSTSVDIGSQKTTRQTIFLLVLEDPGTMEQPFLLRLLFFRGAHRVTLLSAEVHWYIPMYRLEVLMLRRTYKYRPCSLTLRLVLVCSSTRHPGEGEEGTNFPSSASAHLGMFR